MSTTPDRVRSRLVTRVGVAAMLGATACGSGGREDGSGSEESTTTSAAASTTREESSAGTQSSSGAPIPGSTTTTGTTQAVDDAPADGTTLTPPIFDTATQPDGGNGGGCDCGGNRRSSYIWVANSEQDTVSKIDTQTLEEEGRYPTTPGPSFGSPSRTSVSLGGGAVAVANRASGVTKIWALPELCDPLRNGVPGVQTSSGPDDVLPFAEEDCIAWHVDFPAYTTQRPVAWTSGEQNPVTCEHEGAMVWTSGCDILGGGDVWVHLLDGETGVPVADVQVAGFPCRGFGAYGGAVDSHDDFWITANSSNPVMARVDIDDLSTEVIPVPYWPYGIAVDSLDRVWLTANQASPGIHAAQRYDPATGTWDIAMGTGVQGYSGIQEGTDGRMWLNYGIFDGAETMGLTWIDRDTLEVGDPIPIPGAWGRLNGVSIDPEGNVWTVSPDASSVYRYDPDDGDIESYGGLDYPYTYSDMTGSALLNSACGSPVG